MRTLLIILASTLALGASLAGRTQEPPTSLLAQVFPQTTGRNGYEELVRAADLLPRCEGFKRIEGKPATLAQKRAAVEERTVRPVLLLVDAGLKKPISPPRPFIGIKSTRPELPAFRSLMRLLAMRQYVLLAEGKTREAVRLTSDALTLARAVESDSMSGLCGAAMSAVVIRPVGAHLGQLSAADCETLYAACLGVLARPDPTESIYRGEQRLTRSLLEEASRGVLRNEPRAFEDLIGSSDPADTQAVGLRDALIDQLRSDPNRFGSTVNDALRQLDSYFDQQIQELQKPEWERDRKPFKADGALAGRLAQAVTFEIDQLSVRLAAQRCQIQLLAAHCAVLRFRWENDRLPEDLSQLKLGEVGTDPFTGAPFRYQATGIRYRLNSSGYRVDPKEPRGVDGRLPVSIVPGE